MDVVPQAMEETEETAPGAEIVIRFGRAMVSEARDIWRVTRIAYAPYKGVIKPTFGALRVTVGAIRHQIRTGKYFYIVARHEDRVIGTLRCRKRRGYLGLSRLAVLPEYQRNGIGRRLMEWAEEEARRLGLRRLRGEVRAVMPDLLRYYRRMGYRPIGRRSRKGYPGYLIIVQKRL